MRGRFHDQTDLRREILPNRRVQPRRPQRITRDLVRDTLAEPSQRRAGLGVRAETGVHAHRRTNDAGARPIGPERQRNQQTVAQATKLSMTGHSTVGNRNRAASRAIGAAPRVAQIWAPRTRRRRVRRAGGGLIVRHQRRGRQNLPVPHQQGAHDDASI